MRINIKTYVLLNITILTTVGFVFAILALVSGQTPYRLQQSAILTVSLHTNTIGCS